MSIMWSMATAFVNMAGIRTTSLLTLRLGLRHAFINGRRGQNQNNAFVTLSNRSLSSTSSTITESTEGNPAALFTTEHIELRRSLNKVGRSLVRRYDGDNVYSPPSHWSPSHWSPISLVPRLSPPISLVPRLSPPISLVPISLVPHLTGPPSQSPHLIGPHLTGPPSHWPPVSVPPSHWPPSHWSPISLAPRLSPPISLVPISLVPHLTGPPSQSPHLIGPHLTGSLAPHLTVPRLITTLVIINNMIRRYLGASAEISILILTSSLW